MLQRILISAFTVVLLSGCAGNTNSAQENDSSSDGKESTGRLFGGKCAQNQDWLGSLESSITVPANWQSVYDLVNHSTMEDFWGIASAGSAFTTEESVQWNAYKSRLGAAVAQGNYGEAIRMYELLYPLMEKMDLGCAVAVTGNASLSSTIVP
jgi:ABC-type Fe3+-hydroxamate transport system substrate-binding protein